MRSKAVVQLILFITSFVIIFAYIKPAYTDLQEIQLETEEYAKALENAKSFNGELRNQLSDANKITTSQMEKLKRFLPKDIDTIAVMRDIEAIAKRNNMDVKSLTAGSEVSAAGSDSSNVDYLEDDYYEEDPMEGEGGFTSQQNTASRLSKASIDFTVSITGSYEDFKTFLHDIEKNAYPLEVVSLTLAPGSSTEGTVQTAAAYSFNLTLQTYKLASESE